MIRKQYAQLKYKLLRVWGVLWGIVVMGYHRFGERGKS